MFNLSIFGFKPQTNITIIREPLGAISPLISPWGIVDYWLYLTQVVEKGRTKEKRIDEVYLLTANGFQQTEIDFEFLCDRKAEPGAKVFVFHALPVPSISLGLPYRQIILGFDLKTRHLQAYLVDDAPEYLADLEQVWSRAQLIFSIEADQFLHVLERTLTGDLDVLRMGIITYLTESTHELHSALDLVITIQFTQFLYDFAELLGKDMDRSIEPHRRYDDQMRELLQKASTDAWFGARKGLTIEQYRLRVRSAAVSFDSVNSTKETSSLGSEI
jgi:hypothetical protein